MFMIVFLISSFREKSFAMLCCAMYYATMRSDAIRYGTNEIYNHSLTLTKMRK